jgi:hypothetical protein
MGINSFTKQSIWIEGEDWIEPVLAIHTPLSPPLSPQLFLSVRLQLSSKKGKKKNNS